jgi:hypothetical protein
MFSTVYRVAQKDFYAHLYISMWTPDLRQRIIEAVEHKNLFEFLCSLLKT